MTNQALIPNDIAVRYEVHEWRNGLAILSTAHPEEWRNILEVLRDFALLRSDVLKRGGSKGLIAQKLDSHFTRLGWIEKAFDTRIVVDKSTHMAKLLPRLDGGSGGGCPVVVFGIRRTCYVED